MIFELRNEIIDLKGSARIFLRVRPMLINLTGDFPFLLQDEKTTIRHVPKGRDYTFDRVFFPDSTTLDIFMEVEHVIVSTVTSGGLACIFAYGQTASGKTRTMIGGGNIAITLNSVVSF